MTELKVQLADKTSNIVRLAQGLFLLNAAIWIAIGVYTLLRRTVGAPGGIGFVWIMALMMFGNAIVMAFFGWATGRKQRLLTLLGMAFLGVNILLTITDQFGLIDLITLIIDIVLLVLLVVIWWR